MGTPDVRVILGVGYASPRPDPDGGRDDELPEALTVVTDADGDGVPDAADGCPEPEDRDGNQDADGCPDPDDDGDGVEDALDQCRTVGETANGFADEDGCPERVELTANRVVAPIPILFEEGSDRLGDQARESLREVAAALQRETSIRLVQVEGHASGEGNRRRSLSLSERRADSALRFLIDQGVAADRLSSVGNGSEQPEVTGGGDEAHRRNRRVELRIVERAP
jgi:outer membrane protein OmpA-like peptidoglycan-associated protein